MKNLLKDTLECSRVLLWSVYKSLRTITRGERAHFVQEPEEEVIILGNGPSLNDIDLNKLRQTSLKIACVNYFPTRNPSFFTIKPEYLILFDPLFYPVNGQLIPEAKELYEVLEKVDWDMTIVCLQGGKISLQNPRISFERITDSILNSDRMTRYLDCLYHRNLLCIGMQNVVIGAGFYFVCKKVRRIYFSGVDMSEFKMLFVDEENRVYVDAVHSYGTERRYSTIIQKGEFYRLLGMYQGMFKEFHFLSAFAKRSGVDVINLSLCSYIDVFAKKRMFEKE